MTRGGDQPQGERAAFHLADADQLVAQRMELADRRERADAPVLEQRRRSATSSGRRWCAAASESGALGDARRGAGDPGRPRSSRSPRAPARPAPSSRENSSSTASRGRSVRCATSAANTSPKSSKIGSADDEGQRRGRVRAERLRELVGRAPSVRRTHARAACGRSRREWPGLSCAQRGCPAARGSPRTMSTLSLAAPNTRSLVSTTRMPSMSAACAARPSSSLIATTLAGRDRLHDVGALRDAFEPRGRRWRTAHRARAPGKPRLAVEPLAELLLREPRRAARPAARGPDRAARWSARTRPRTRPSRSRRRR